MCFVDAFDDKDSLFVVFSICILYFLATNLFLCISSFVFIFQFSEHLFTSHFLFFYYKIIWLLDLNLLLLCQWFSMSFDILDFCTANARVILLSCSCVDCVLWFGFGFSNVLLRCTVIILLVYPLVVFLFMVFFFFIICSFFC